MPACSSGASDPLPGVPTTRRERAADSGRRLFARVKDYTFMTAILKHGLSPPTAGLFGHLPAFVRDPLGFLTDCARSHRGIVRLRMLHKPVFLLLEPADIERVLVTEYRDFIKPAWLRTPAVRRLLGDGLVTAEGEAWRRQRHACQPAFQLRRMERYGEVISSLAELALTRWEPGQAIDVQQEMARLTLEILGRLLFAVHETDWTDEAGRAMDSLMARFTAGRSLFGMIPWPPGPGEVRATRRLNGVVERLIRRHAETRPSRASDPDSLDLLSMFQNPDADGGEGLSGRPLREQVKTFLTAGHESSALALSWAFLLLARHPTAGAALASELETVLSGRPPVPSDLPHLPYTQAVVQETLRLYPPLWMTGRQATRSCKIGGVSVPAGALVMTSQWAMQRLPQFFPCPDDFRPERWLGTETKDLPRCAYFPFGAGPRICIGQSFALMEATLLLAAIARRFRFESVPGPELKPWATMTLRPPTGIRVRLLAKEKAAG